MAGLFDGLPASTTAGRKQPGRKVPRDLLQLIPARNLPSKPLSPENDGSLELELFHSSTSLIIKNTFGSSRNVPFFQTHFS